MSPPRASWPSAIADEAALEELLSRPSAADVEFARSLEGDVIVLGAGGKMGPSLARRVRRAFGEAGLARRVMAVARFSEPGLAERLAEDGIEAISCDLLDPAQVAQLPKAGNVLFLAGRKFGSSGRPDLTWSQNVVVPAIVAPQFAESRIVVFSSGNVYPLVAPGARGPTAHDPVAHGRVRADLRRPRAHLRARGPRARHALPAVPAVLRGRPALRHAGGPRAHGARRRAGRPARGSRQRDLAGRRELVRVPWARALREPRYAVGCDGPGSRLGPRGRGALRRALRAHGPLHRRTRPCRARGHPSVSLLGRRRSRSPLLEWVANGLARRPRLGKPTHFGKPMAASEGLRRRFLEARHPRAPLSRSARSARSTSAPGRATRYHAEAARAESR